MNKKTMTVFLSALASLIIMQDIEKKIIEKYANSLYVIKYLETISPSPNMTERQEATRYRYILGIAVKDDLILTSSINFQSARRGEQKQNFVYVIIDEKTELKAKFIGENTEMNMAYYKLVEEGKKLNFIDVSKMKETKISIGESIFILDKFLATQELNFPIRIRSRKVEMVLEKPTVEYVTDVGSFGIEPLGLVFNSKGELSGIFSPTQNAKKEATSQPSGLLLFPSETPLNNFLVIKPISFLQRAAIQVPTEIKKGWLGLFNDTLEFITKEEAEEFLNVKEEQKGLRIASVAEQTPIYKSGLKAGDIIIKIGDFNCVVKEARDIPPLLEKIAASLEIGKTIKIKYLRKNEQRVYIENEANVIVEERPILFTEVEEYEEKKFGVRVKELTFDYKYRTKIPITQTGLVITFVKEGSPAAIGGIIAGDILISLSIPGKNIEKEIKTIDELRKIIDELSQSKPTELIAKIFSGKETKSTTLRNINW